jgi:hypothetical protein
MRAGDGTGKAQPGGACVQKVVESGLKHVKVLPTFSFLPIRDTLVPACSEQTHDTNMAPHITGRTKPTKPKKQQRATKRKRDDVDVEKLEQQVQDLVRLV